MSLRWTPGLWVTRCAAAGILIAALIAAGCGGAPADSPSSSDVPASAADTTDGERSDELGIAVRTATPEASFPLSTVRVGAAKHRVIDLVGRPGFSAVLVLGSGEHADSGGAEHVSLLAVDPDTATLDGSFGAAGVRRVAAADDDTRADGYSAVAAAAAPDGGRLAVAAARDGDHRGVFAVYDAEGEVTFSAPLPAGEHPVGVLASGTGWLVVSRATAGVAPGDASPITAVLFRTPGAQAPEGIETAPVTLRPPVHVVAIDAGGADSSCADADAPPQAAIAGGDAASAGTVTIARLLARVPDGCAAAAAGEPFGEAGSGRVSVSLDSERLSVRDLVLAADGLRLLLNAADGDSTRPYVAAVSLQGQPVARFGRGGVAPAADGSPLTEALSLATGSGGSLLVSYLRRTGERFGLTPARVRLDPRGRPVTLAGEALRPGAGAEVLDDVFTGEEWRQPPARIVAPSGDAELVAAVDELDGHSEVVLAVRPLTAPSTEPWDAP